MTRAEVPIAELRGISKSYDGVRVLRDATISLSAGTVHALVGGNGSGKSTLSKIIAGAIKGDAGGHIRVGDVEAESHKWGREHSLRAHIHVVHQDPCVFENATVAENLAVGPGFITGVGGRIKWRALEARAREILDRFCVSADPDTYVSELRGAERTKLAIARALQDEGEYDSGLLILDEPTAALPKEEIERLITWIRGYAAGGRSILFVSHHLDEVLGLADEISILRDGNLVATRDRHHLNEHSLVELITGRTSEALKSSVSSVKSQRHEATALEVRGLVGGAVQGADVEVGRGEIVGVAGLLGSGRTTLLELIYGAKRRAEGDITVQGVPFDGSSPRRGVQAGLMYVPETRAHSGFFGMSVLANLSATVVPSYAPFGRFRHSKERADAASVVTRYSIRTHSIEQNLEHLSGGNQQKTIVARASRCTPAVLLLDEPTQGVDVGARADIHRFLRESAASGMAILVVSSDLEELATLCDRIVVMDGGRTVAELHGPAIETDAVVAAVYEGTLNVDA